MPEESFVPKFQIGSPEAIAMAILITGGAGYIGSHMVYELADRGEQPVVIDDFSSGFEWATPSGVPVFVGDIGNQRRVASLIAKYGISEIIHFAASVVAPESVAEPLRYYRNNTANCRSLFEMATKSGVKRFIFSSTAAVYGNPPVILSRKRPPLRLYHLTAHPNSWPKQCCVMLHALMAYATSS
jgi:UDP-glucose 4-epimerase